MKSETKTKPKGMRHILIMLVSVVVILGCFMMKNYYFSPSTNIRLSCGISKEDFIKTLSRESVDPIGFFSRNAEYLWEIAQKEQINEFVLPGIIAFETTFGSYTKSANNYANLISVNNETPEFIPFETERDFIDYFITLVSTGNYSDVITFRDFASLWCPNSTDYPNQSEEWSSNVISHINKLSKVWLPYYPF